MDEEYVTYEIDEAKKSWRERLNNFLDSRYFIATVIVLIAIIAFALGRISGLQDKREPVRVISENANTNNPLNPPYIRGEIEETNSAASTASTSQGGSVVASKNGTKYHYPWCAGAKQISEKNLITFNSIESARAAGYTPASNCKGLK